MYLAVDIGGTKTLVAGFDSAGNVSHEKRFETPVDYAQFAGLLESNVVEIKAQSIEFACVAFPGKVDRVGGIGIAGGNLVWKNVPLVRDLTKLLGCPVYLENDAKLAALSEAKSAGPEARKVLYVTIGTGIGTGVVTDGKLDPSYADMEGGHVLIEQEDGGKPKKWEQLASGKAIVEKYGKKASDIDDPAVWHEIATNIAVGLADNIAIVQPDTIVIGGGVGRYFEKFINPLYEILKSYESPLLPIPPIKPAQHPEEAVLYGCYELIRQHL